MFENGFKALGDRFGGHRTVQPPEVVVLVGIVAHFGGCFGVFPEIILDLCLMLRVRVEQAICVSQEVNFTDEIASISHLTLLTIP
jgi:hypothetical protein